MYQRLVVLTIMVLNVPKNNALVRVSEIGAHSLNPFAVVVVVVERMYVMHAWLQFWVAKSLQAELKTSMVGTK